jgi:hypothetical protein
MTRKSRDFHTITPFNLAKRGLIFGVTTTFFVYAFCGYLVSLGGAGTYIGGILGAGNSTA